MSNIEKLASTPSCQTHPPEKVCGRKASMTMKSWPDTKGNCPNAHMCKHPTACQDPLLSMIWSSVWSKNLRHSTMKWSRSRSTVNIHFKHLQPSSKAASQPTKNRWTSGLRSAPNACTEKPASELSHGTWFPVHPIFSPRNVVPTKALRTFSKVYIGMTRGDHEDQRPEA